MIIAALIIAIAAYVLAIIALIYSRNTRKGIIANEEREMDNAT